MHFYYVIDVLLERQRHRGIKYSTNFSFLAVLQSKIKGCFNIAKHPDWRITQDD